VFEVFKVNAPECIGFAKHREATERNAAALAAAEADAGETATSPRAAPKRAGKKNAPTTSAIAEGRTRKKRGGRPADSPPVAKRTRIVDVETGVVKDVIATVPLRSAAPSVEVDEETCGPLLVPFSPKEKDSDDDNEVRIMCSVGEAPRGHSPTAFGPDTPKTKASPAPLPLVRPAHRLRAPSNPLPPRPRAPKKMILLPPRRKAKRKRKSPTVAATG
jgi:hypothetical protein